MTDVPEHKAEGPEEEITSEGLDVLAEHVAGTPPLGHVPTAHAAADDVPGAEELEPTQDELAKEPQAHPAPKLERLQKILAQAGIASRRHAEELITQGRVQVNGQVVTTLGSKADPERDHIRVDGTLLHGAERHRYFMLNKPRGYVTTVSDPENRPTVMQLFGKMRERLYPVGRLDYQSEGLLLVTNDGELANRLTRAASGVEKTYLVKVAGKPSQEVLDRIGQGISIDRGKPGMGRLRTAPARIRPIRARAGAENPWYEVGLIEGRNRELRKIFEEVGHHVEKIRRVAYGPLTLDVEPGKFRELEPGEVAQLRLAAEGRLRPRRLNTSTILGQDAGKKLARDEKSSGDRSRHRRPEARKREEKGPVRKGRAWPVGDRQERVERGPGRHGERRPFAGRGGQRPDLREAGAASRFGKSGSEPAKFLRGDRSGSERPGGSSKDEKSSGDRSRHRRPEARKREEKGPVRKGRAWPAGDRQERVERGPGRRGERRPFAGRGGQRPDLREAGAASRFGKSGSEPAKFPRGDRSGSERPGGSSKDEKSSGDRSRHGRPEARKREENGPVRKGRAWPAGDRQDRVERGPGRRGERRPFAGRGQRPDLREAGAASRFGKSGSEPAKFPRGDRSGSERPGGSSKDEWREGSHQKTGRRNRGPHPGTRRPGS